MEITPNPPLVPATQRNPDTVDGTAEQASAASADFDSFLRLLTAQLRNQDPLQPMDSTEFVAQLASFSTVEQLIGTNSRLDLLADQGETESAALYAGWIGREASLTDGRFVATGEEIRFGYTAEPAADRAIALVRREDGTPVASIALDPRQGGDAVWDGVLADGSQAAGPLDLVIGYYAGDELVAERAGEVYRLVSGLRGGGDGVLVSFADGGSATPGEISGLRARTEPETDEG